MKKWIFLSCSESHEINFEICWNCQYFFNENERLIDVPQKKKILLKRNLHIINFILINNLFFRGFSIPEKPIKYFYTIIFLLTYYQLDLVFFLYKLII